MFSGRGPPGPPPNGPPGQPPLGPPGGPLGPGMTQGGPNDGTWNPTGAPGQGDGSWQSPGQPLPGLLGALGGGLGGGGLGVGVGMGLGPMIPPVLPPGGPSGAEGGGPPPLAPPVLGPGASPPHGSGSSPHSLTPPGGVCLLSKYPGKNAPRHFELLVKFRNFEMVWYMSYQNTTALKVGNFPAVKGGHQSATCKGDDQECSPNPRKGSLALSRQNC